MEKRIKNPKTFQTRKTHHFLKTHHPLYPSIYQFAWKVCWLLSACLRHGSFDFAYCPELVCFVRFVWLINMLSFRMKCIVLYYCKSIKIQNCHRYHSRNIKCKKKKNLNTLQSKLSENTIIIEWTTSYNFIKETKLYGNVANSLSRITPEYL